MYFSKLPKEAFTKDVLFFGHFRASLPALHVLGTVVASLLAKIHLNRSYQGCVRWLELKARSQTIAYELLQLLRCTKMGYLRKSSKKGWVTETLRIYERTNHHQQEAASNILSVPQAQNYAEQMYAVSYHSQTTSVNFEPLHSNSTDSVRRLPLGICMDVPSISTLPLTPASHPIHSNH